jgi:hypothetical protein
MGRALQMTKLYFVGSKKSMQIDGELDLQEFVVFMPIYLSAEF